MPMQKKLRLLVFLVSVTAFSQDIAPYKLFSFKIGKHIKQYTHNADAAYENSNFERGEFLFDSLVKNVVNGSYMDNFKMKRLSGKSIGFHEFKKPVFLMTYASWCTPGVGEIPALNQIAAQYYKEIDFVILFWNSRAQVKQVAAEYSTKINIVYVDETENIHDHVIESMKHSLGFPTSFFIAKNKQILDVRRGALHPYNEAYAISFELNHQAFANGISLLLSQEQFIPNELIGKN